MSETIQWGKISTPVEDRFLMRGHGKTVEWTILPSMGRRADECEVKISLLSAHANFRRDDFNWLDNVAEGGRLRSAGKIRDAHIHHQRTTIGNWEFFRTGSQSEALAIVDAFERDDNEAIRPNVALKAAGFKFKWFHANMENPVWTYHKSIKSGFFVLHISRNHLSVQYEPNPGGMGHPVFFVLFAEDDIKGSRMKTLWPANVRFPLRKAVAIAIMTTEMRASSGRPSRPTHPVPLPEFA